MARRELTAPRTRFAPTPSGELHVGAARAALFNWLYARSRGGTFVVRIEDTDPQRSRAEFGRSILNDLTWLGLDWDEGPDRGGPYAPYSQSERQDLYRKAATSLLEKGLLYRCFCAAETLDAQRKRQKGAGRTVRYSGTCRDLTPEDVLARSKTEPFALRLKAPATEIRFVDRVKGKLAFPADSLDDVIVVRTDGTASYNFACVVDDASMKISHVIRGEDLLSATPTQILLYEALGEEIPVFSHLPTVTGPDQSKLSKRHGARSVSALRLQGFLPEALLNALALLGWSDPDGREVLTITELRRAFSLEKVGRSSSVFDGVKLRWLNGQHLREREPGELLKLCRRGLELEGILGGGDELSTLEWLQGALGVAVHSAERPQDMVDRLRPLWDFGPGRITPPILAALRSEERGVDILRLFLARHSEVELGEFGELRRLVELLAAELDLKPKQLFHPLRLALTAEDSGMELDRLVPLMATPPEGLKARVPHPATRVETTLGVLAVES